MLRFLVVGFKPVSNDMALYRARLCSLCVLNQPRVSWGSLIRKASWYVMLRVGKKSEFDHKTLGHCELCGCYLPMKIWVPPTKLNTPDEIMELKPSHCWLQ